VDDLRAIPRIDIYGQDLARQILYGQFWDTIPAAGATTLHPYSGGSNSVHSGGSGSTLPGGEYASGGSNSASVTGGSGSSSRNQHYWSIHVYGSAIVRPGTMIQISGA